jgi:hypothetical protein
MIARSVVALGALLVFASTAGAQVADHLQCFKIKDSATKTSYTADLVPNDLGFLVSTGCTIQVPAKHICIDVEKQNVTPSPPGSPDGAPAQRYLCYKTKCLKQQPVISMQDQFGNRSVTVKTTSLVCAPEPAPVTTTTTTLPCPNFDNDMDSYFAPPCGADCNDNVNTINPGAVEICGTSVDEDCDGSTDEAGCTCTTSAQCPASQPNTIGICQAGSCTTACSTDYADCNVNSVDGCEVYTAADPNNCGGCNVVCPIPTPNCVNSTCQP